MTENARVLNTAIRAHLQGLIRSSGLPETEDSLAEMARVWFEKKDMFEAQIKALDMRELERFSADDPRGALLLTWSGSLLSMGPARGRPRGKEDRVREHRASHGCPAPCDVRAGRARIRPDPWSAGHAARRTGFKHFPSAHDSRL